MKIAIIGSGISGLSAAYLLNNKHEISLYEKNSYLGGHSRTIDIKTIDGLVAVDTGFIVFNQLTYPLLTALFENLAIETALSDMSFGVSVNNGKFEYGTKYPLGIIAQKSSLISIKFWRMIYDIIKFNNKARLYLTKDYTLKEFIQELGFSEYFQKYYLLAMGSAIWSTPIEKMLDFPAKTFIRFFENHGLLTIMNHPQWYTVKGGSRQYVNKISAGFQDKIKLNCEVIKAKRQKDGVEIKLSDGTMRIYDKVIFASSSHCALSILDNPLPEEKQLLGAIKFQPNKVIVHSDESFMPKRTKAWASWVYLASEDVKNTSLTYWMNSLQPLNTKQKIFVTLNPSVKPRQATIYDEYEFAHPIFDQDAIDAQSNIDKIQGHGGIYYCGAWQTYGFHEDGIASAVKVAAKLGVDIPWK